MTTTGAFVKPLVWSIRIANTIVVTSHVYTSSAVLMTALSGCSYGAPAHLHSGTGTVMRCINMYSTTTRTCQTIVVCGLCVMLSVGVCEGLFDASAATVELHIHTK